MLGQVTRHWEREKERERATEGENERDHCESEKTSASEAVQYAAVIVLTHRKATSRTVRENNGLS